MRRVCIRSIYSHQVTGSLHIFGYFLRAYIPAAEDLMPRSRYAG